MHHNDAKHQARNIKRHVQPQISSPMCQIRARLQQKHACRLQFDSWRDDVLLQLPFPVPFACARHRARRRTNLLLRRRGFRFHERREDLLDAARQPVPVCDGCHGRLGSGDPGLRIPPPLPRIPLPLPRIPPRFPILHHRPRTGLRLGSPSLSPSSPPLPPPPPSSPATAPPPRASAAPPDPPWTRGGGRR